MYIVERSKNLEKKSINLKIKKPTSRKHHEMFSIDNDVVATTSKNHYSTYKKHNYNFSHYSNNNKTNINNINKNTNYNINSDTSDNDDDDDDFYSVYSDSGNKSSSFKLSMNQLYLLNDIKCVLPIQSDQFISLNTIFLYEKQFDIPYNVSINNSSTILYVKTRSKYLDKRSVFSPNQNTIILERQLSTSDHNDKKVLALKSSTNFNVNGDEFLFNTYIKDDYSQFHNLAQKMHHYKRVSSYKFIEYIWDMQLIYMGDKYIFEIAYIVVDELKEKSISIKCRNKLMKPNIFYMIYYAIKEYLQFQILQSSQIDSQLLHMDEFLCYNDEHNLLTYNQMHAILSMNVNELRKSSDELKLFCNYVNGIK